MSGLMIPRRRFLAGSLASAAVASPFGIVRGAPVTFSADPYTLGIASGCPREDRAKPNKLIKVWRLDISIAERGNCIRPLVIRHQK